MIILLSECTVWAQQWGQQLSGLVGGHGRGGIALRERGSRGRADARASWAWWERWRRRQGDCGERCAAAARAVRGGARADGALKKGDTGQGRAPLFAAPVRKLALLSQLQVPFSPRGNGRDTAWRLLDRAGWRGATREKGDAEASERMRRTLRLRARRGERRRAGPPRRPPGGFSAGTSTRPRGFRTHKDSSTSRRSPHARAAPRPLAWRAVPPPPPFRTKWTRRVHHLVLIGHAPPPASFSQGGRAAAAAACSAPWWSMRLAGRRGCQGGRAGCGRRSS